MKRLCHCLFLAVFFFCGLSAMDEIEISSEKNRALLDEISMKIMYDVLEVTWQAHREGNQSNAAAKVASRVDGYTEQLDKLATNLVLSRLPATEHLQKFRYLLEEAPRRYMASAPDASIIVLTFADLLVRSLHQRLEASSIVYDADSEDSYCGQCAAPLRRHYYGQLETDSDEDAPCYSVAGTCIGHFKLCRDRATQTSQRSMQAIKPQRPDA